MKLKHLIPVLVIGITSIIACKDKPKDEPKPEPTATRADLSRDSIFLYAKEMYLWNTALPSYASFNPRQYTSRSTDFLNYEQELIALANIAQNPATGMAYEYFANGADSKYSYITDIADKNPVAYVPTQQSAVDLEGNGNDFGIKLIPYGNGSTTSDPNDFYLFISAVYPSSPADKAGLKRSYRITKIDGVAVGANYTTEVTTINNKFNGTVINLEGTKYVNDVPSGTFTATLNKAVYKSSPILASNVITSGAKKIGYLAYARFSTLTNTKPDLDAAFANFSASGVTDLIIDLRYNGGGYVNTAQYLINQIAPSSTNGKVMFTETYNALMQSGQAKILANQPFLDPSGKVQFQNGKMITYADLDYSVAGNTEKFVKAGPLDNINSVVFIVMGGTASASELVINSLKPFMNVKLVGTKTYGKPVGFFPITIENKYEVYYSLFQTKNSLGQGEYFAGFTPDVVDSYDDAAYNFGDAGENLIAKAIGVLNGTITTSAPATKVMSIDGKSVSRSNLVPMKAIGGNEFLGMIETNHKLKK